MGRKVLIIDDEETVRYSLRQLFEARDFEVREAEAGGVALDTVRPKKGVSFNPDVILLDVQLPDGSGLDILEDLQEAQPDACVIVITGYGNVPQSVEAMQKGAVDYVLKPFNLDEILIRIEKVLENRHLKEQVGYLSKRVYGDWESRFVQGPNKEMKRIFQNLEVIGGSSTATVFIHGETGTGKELIAHRIHELSPRSSHSFVEINATALTAELLESELFGHEAGAFTGATQAKKGLFEVASGGTLFLDEIGDMDLAMQAKILRALQERRIRRVGGTQNIEVDIRLITATNRNLEDAVKEGTFREDLFFRLNVVPINLPPLRERPDDIPFLVEHFIREFNGEFGRKVEGLTPEAMELLQKYHWPGNIRELRNLFERTILLEPNKKLIDVKELHFSYPFEDKGTESLPDKGMVGTEVSLEEVESKHIAGVLESQGGNKNKAAQILGIDRTTLYNKIKKYEIAS